MVEKGPSVHGKTGKSEGNRPKIPAMVAKEQEFQITEIDDLINFLLWEQGLSQKDAAHYMGIGDKTFRQWSRLRGIRKRTFSEISQLPWTDKRREESRAKDADSIFVPPEILKQPDGGIIYMYDALGMSGRMIQKRTRKGRMAVRRILVDAKVSIRKQKEAAQTRWKRRKKTESP